METGDDILAFEREAQDPALVKAETGGSFKKVFWFLLRIALAVAIIGWLLHKHIDTFVDNLKNINWLWMGLACSAYIFHMFVCSWRWFRLAHVLGVKFSFLEAVALTMKGYFFSLVIPGGSIGGDVAKIGFLTSRAPKGEKIEGAFSILVDRMTGMVGLFTVALIVISCSIPMLMRVQLDVIKLNDTLRVVGIVVLMGMCLAGLLAMLAMFFHDILRKVKPIDWLMKLGDKYTHGAVTRLTSAIDTYRGSWKLVLKMCITSAFLVHLNMVFVVYLIMKALGMSGINPLYVISAVIIGNIAGLLPFTVSGVGLRDVTISVILVAGGICNSATIPILYTAIIIVFNILAGIFFIYDPGRNRRTG
ncbi:lysylphosphatidylglycerol synthase transmembrane domain-containing protein [Lentisphaerota bacterium ZTH]|nr:flippase-like domain-containing protein [Lentisphaerota bacterium]WET05648.1 lysylphosphatidylglycerol synthase transmembrane domain-containing protein [Lentisphaerota bacterium ZTH]